MILERKYFEHLLHALNIYLLMIKFMSTIGIKYHKKTLQCFHFMNMSSDNSMSLIYYLFNSKRCKAAVKYCVSGQVLETHCTAAFIKQVLPRLLSPVAPFSVGAGIIIIIRNMTQSNFNSSSIYRLKIKVLQPKHHHKLIALFSLIKIGYYQDPKYTSESCIYNKILN